MQALIELIAGFVALLAAAALSHFGVDADSRRDEPAVARFKPTGGPSPTPPARPQR